MLQPNTATGPPVVSMSHVQNPRLRHVLMSLTLLVALCGMSSNLIRRSRARETHFMANWLKMSHRLASGTREAAVENQWVVRLACARLRSSLLELSVSFEYFVGE
jgi:hypothetical protein